MREIRTLRAMWRGLETESRSELTRARHTRKGGHRRSRDLRATAPVLDPTTKNGSVRQTPLKLLHAIGLRRSCENSLNQITQ